MALHWSVEKIKDFKEVCLFEEEEGEYILGPKTDAMIWMTAFVGINQITEENIERFKKRIRLYQNAGATLLTDDEGNPVFLTDEDVERHVGLWTNASHMSDIEFVNKIMGILNEKEHHDEKESDNSVVDWSTDGNSC